MDEAVEGKKADVPMRTCGSGKNGEWAYTSDIISIQICSLRNVSNNQQNHRRSLSSEEKESYIKAVQCLHELPPKLKQNFDAVHSRYDDFVFFLSIPPTPGSCFDMQYRLPTI